MELNKWHWALSARGEGYAQRDMKRAKLSTDAVAKLELAMERVEKGTSRPGEIGPVRGGIWEVRVNIDKRWYRLLYQNDGSAFVALVFITKKSNKLEKADIDLAAKRLTDHRKAPKLGNT